MKKQQNVQISMYIFETFPEPLDSYSGEGGCTLAVGRSQGPPPQRSGASRLQTSLGPSIVRPKNKLGLTPVLNNIISSEYLETRVQASANRR